MIIFYMMIGWMCEFVNMWLHDCGTTVCMCGWNASKHTKKHASNIIFLVWQYFIIIALSFLLRGHLWLGYIDHVSTLLLTLTYALVANQIVFSFNTLPFSEGNFLTKRNSVLILNSALVFLCKLNHVNGYLHLPLKTKLYLSIKMLKTDQNPLIRLYHKS